MPCSVYDFSFFFNEKAAAVKFNFLFELSLFEKFTFFFSSVSSASVCGAFPRFVKRFANFSDLRAPFDIALNLFLEFITR